MIVPSGTPSACRGLGVGEAEHVHGDDGVAVVPGQGGDRAVHLGGDRAQLGVEAAAVGDVRERAGLDRRRPAARAGLVVGDERVAQDAVQVGQVVAVHEARLGQHAQADLLDEVLGVGARPAHGERRAEQPVEVQGEGLGGEDTGLVREQAWACVRPSCRDPLRPPPGESLDLNLTSPGIEPPIRRPRHMDVRRWWLSGQAPWVKFVEAFLVANALAAVLSLLLAPGSEDWFTWTIAPDASARLLAVMYANALVLGVLALRQPDWAHARVLFVLITVFALAATAMTFFQLDPFLAHPWYHLAYWLGGYAVLVATAPVVLVSQERRHGGRLPVTLPMTRLQRAGGAAAGTAMGAAALALLVSPAGSATCGRGRWRRSPAACSASGSARSRWPTPGRCATATGPAPGRSTSPRPSRRAAGARAAAAPGRPARGRRAPSWPSTTRWPARRRAGDGLLARSRARSAQRLAGERA